MEIEKKYLVKYLPDHLEQYDKWEIEQAYLCSDPTIRVRKKNDEYILTYKSRAIPDFDPAGEKLCVAQEVELPLTRSAYESLKEKREGRCISKTRYRIPFGKYTIELDVFHGELDSFLLAEVEFDSLEEGQSFEPPEWFDKDVSGDYHYTNSYLSSQ